MATPVSPDVSSTATTPPAGRALPSATRSAARARVRTAVILLLLFFTAWIPRMLDLDAFVTIDERKWLARSANFLYAVSHADWANTFQREHPGVTVMWAGTLGLLNVLPDYPAIAPGPFTWEKEVIEPWLKENTDVTPLEALTAGRRWIAFGVALFLALGFLPLRRLIGEGPAILATLFVAWDPWAVALSRQLHPDGFVNTFIFLALLLFLSWLYAGRRTRDLILSGAVMGLAWLTKTPAIFLVPAGFILVTIEWWRERRDPQRTGRLWRIWAAYILWGVAASAVFFLLWPSMWVDPLGTFVKIGAEMEEYVERHTRVNYFLGQPAADPGLIFYPIAWFFRTTPAVIVGLLSAAWFGWRRKALSADPVVRRTVGALLIFTLVYVAGMSVGAKKFDRYLLPIFPALDVIAALGWVALAGWVAQRLRVGERARVAVVAIAAAALIALHAAFTALHYPYYLTYFNPLAGGSRTAPWAMIMGWGEGLDQAAAFLNALPDAKEQVVASWYYEGPLSYYLDGSPANLDSGSPRFWFGVDYAITYVNQWQRQLPDPGWIEWFDEQTPLHTVRFRGLDLARVYDLRGKGLPDFLDITQENVFDFGDKIQMLAYEFEKPIVQPGEENVVVLDLKALREMTTNYNILVRLVARDGSEVWRHEGWPWGAPTIGWEPLTVRLDGHTIAVPADTPPGVYQILVSMYDPETLEMLPNIDPQTGDDTGRSESPIALLQVGDAPQITGGAVSAGGWSFGDAFALDGASIQGEPSVGSPLELRLLWRSVKRTGTPYTTFVHVVGPDGTLVAQSDSPPQGGFAATNLWLTGQSIEDAIQVALPADAPPGEYEVRVGLYAGAQRLPVSVDGQPAGDFATVTTFTLP